MKLTEDEIEVIKNEFTQDAQDIILDGLKALEYDALRRKENVELNLENQKLKVENEELKKEISYWKNLHNESLQREDKLGEKLEDYNKILDTLKRSYCEDFDVWYDVTNMISNLKQENDQLKEVSRQRGFTISDLQDHENTLNGQIHQLKKKQCWKCGANQDYMTNK